MTERIKTVLAVYLLLEGDSGLLFLRRKNSGWEDGRYTVPAGHVDFGESAKTAMVREAAEEDGVVVDADDLEMVHLMHRNDREPYLDVYFRCRRWTGAPRIAEPDKSDDLLWAPGDDLPVGVISTVRQAVEAVKQGIPYSEAAWKVASGAP